MEILEASTIDSAAFSRVIEALQTRRQHHRVLSRQRALRCTPTRRLYSRLLLQEVARVALISPIRLYKQCSKIYYRWVLRRIK